MKILDMSDNHNEHDMLVNTEFAVACMRAEGGGVLKCVHASYAQRNAFRSHIRKAMREGAVKDMIAGERFAPEEAVTRCLCSLFPEVTEDPDLGKHNEYVTILRI